MGFRSEHDDFVGALDHLFPASENAASYTEDFLVKLVPLYDDHVIPDATERLAAALQDLQQDPAALGALAALAHRVGYVDLAHERALLRRIHGFKDYQKLASELVAMLMAHDGLDDAGNPDPSEDDAVTRLLRGVARRLQSLARSEGSDRDVVLASDLLLTEDPRFGRPPSGGPQVGGPQIKVDSSTAASSVVARDVRGMALARLGRGLPFVDLDRDGLADIDALGRFLGGDGAPLAVAPFQQPGPSVDAAGRPTADRAARGQLLFSYVNLDRTMAAGLLRDSRSLIARGVPLKAKHALDAALGARTATGTFSPDNGLVDAVHGAGAALDLETFPDLLEVLRAMLLQHEPALARTVYELDQTLDIADRYDLALQPGNTFFSDLMDVVKAIAAVPGLTEDLLRATEDPAVRAAGAGMARLMRFKSPRLTQADVDDGTVFATAVDRSRPDSSDNLSLFQRTLHLVHATAGAKWYPNFDSILRFIPFGGALAWHTDDIGGFYLEAVAGTATLPRWLSWVTQHLPGFMPLSENPTPAELAAFINHFNNFLVGNPTDDEGLPIRENDGDTLFAVAAPLSADGTGGSFADAARPIALAFAQHDQIPLLERLFDVLYQHWGSPEGHVYQSSDPAGRLYSKLSGARRFEPMLIDQFENAHLVEAVNGLLTDSDALRSSHGRGPITLLASAGVKLLLPDPALRTRSGAAAVTLDGRQISPLAPFDLLRAGRARLKAALAGTPGVEAQWDDVVGALHDVFLRCTLDGPAGGSSAHFANARAVPFAAILTAFLHDRATRHLAAGDLETWTRRDLENLAGEVVGAPELPALLDLVEAIDARPALSDTIAELRDDLLAEDDGLEDTLSVAGDLLGAIKDGSVGLGAMHWLGRTLDPDRKLAFALTRMAAKAIAADSDQHILEVIRRALDESPLGGVYGEALLRTLRQTNRVVTTSTQTVDAADLEAIAAKVGGYMTDDQHGLEKFYTLARDRK